MHPRVVLVGDRASGKSALLSQLTKVSCFFGRMTTYPVIVSTKKSDNQRVLVNETEITDQMNKDSTFLGRAVESASGPVTDGRISDIPVYITVEGPEMLDITVVDLPGMVHDGSPDGAAIEKLIKYYLAPKTALILAVVEASVNCKYAASLSLAKEFDEYGERTLRVLTKFDVFGDDAQRQMAINVVRDSAHSVICRPRGRSHNEDQEISVLCGSMGLPRSNAGVDSARDRVLEMLSSLNPPISRSLQPTIFDLKSEIIPDKCELERELDVSLLRDQFRRNVQTGFKPSTFMKASEDTPSVRWLTKTHEICNYKENSPDSLENCPNTQEIPSRPEKDPPLLIVNIGHRGSGKCSQLAELLELQCSLPNTCHLGIFCTKTSIQLSCTVADVEIYDTLAGLEHTVSQAVALEDKRAPSLKPVMLDLSGPSMFDLTAVDIRSESHLHLICDILKENVLENDLDQMLDMCDTTLNEACRIFSNSTEKVLTNLVNCEWLDGTLPQTILDRFLKLLRPDFDKGIRTCMEAFLKIPKSLILVEEYTRIPIQDDLRKYMSEVIDSLGSRIEKLSDLMSLTDTDTLLKCEIIEKLRTTLGQDDINDLIDENLRQPYRDKIDEVISLVRDQLNQTGLEVPEWIKQGQKSNVDLVAIFRAKQCRGSYRFRQSHKFSKRVDDFMPLLWGSDTGGVF